MSSSASASDWSEVLAGRYGEGANFKNNCGAGFDRAGERYQPPSLNAASNLELADFELLLKQSGHYR